MYREAFTYINITKSDLQPILITGSVAKVTRGWGQMLILSPQDLSLDPDNVDDKVKTVKKNISLPSWGFEGAFPLLLL